MNGLQALAILIALGGIYFSITKNSVLVGVCSTVSALLFWLISPPEGSKKNNRKGEQVPEEEKKKRKSLSITILISFFSLAFFYFETMPKGTSALPDIYVTPKPTFIPAQAPTPTPQVIYVTPESTPTPSISAELVSSHLYYEDSTAEKKLTVQVCQSKDLEACETCVSRLQKAGYNAFIYKRPNEMYRILIGVFESKSEAEDFAAYVKDQPSVKGTSTKTAYVTNVKLSSSDKRNLEDPWY